MEPGLRDVYTESRDDARFFRWYFRETGIAVDGVYAVDDRVIVDREKVLGAGGEVGPRGRLIGLAAEVATWGLQQPAITCIVDADRDVVFGGPEYPDLLKTDGGSIEVYLLSPRPVQHFLDMVVGHEMPAETLIAGLLPAFNELFLIRAVLHLYGPDVALIEKFHACCRPQGNVWVVDSEALISRSLAAGSAASSRDAVLTRLEEARIRLPENRALAVRGHDIAPLLVKSLGLTNDWAKVEVLEKSLRGCLQVKDLAEQPLFVALRQRLG